MERRSEMKRNSRMFKKSMTFALVLALSILAASCSDQKTTASSDPVYVPAPAAPVPVPNISTPPSTISMPELLDEILIEFKIFDPDLDEISVFWNEMYVLSKSSMTTFATRIYLKGSASTSCGNQVLSADGDDGPAYCNATDEIVIPTAFTLEMVKQQLITGQGRYTSDDAEVAIFFILAHEWGHNIQTEVFGVPNTSNAPSVEMENTSDCLAGLAVAGVPRTFKQKDVATILALSAVAGEPLGGTHGTPDQRQAAATMGMNHPYENRPGLLTGLDECIQTYDPTLYATLK
jgi:hypothetical protein